MSTGIHHHVLRSVSLSIHPCICPPLSSSSHPSIYLAIHEFFWAWTLLAIFRSSDLCFYLSISPSISLAISLTIYLSVCLSIYLFLYMSVCPSICVSIYLYVYLYIYLSIYLSIDRSIYLSIYLSNCLSIYRYNIRTSKSGVNMRCFVHFDFEMCFAPQRRALFQHPNLHKWREHVVFCTF